MTGQKTSIDPSEMNNGEGLEVERPTPAFQYGRIEGIARSVLRNGRRQE